MGGREGGRLGRIDGKEGDGGRMVVGRMGEAALRSQRIAIASQGIAIALHCNRVPLHCNGIALRSHCIALQSHCSVHPSQDEATETYRNNTSNITRRNTQPYAFVNIARLVGRRKGNSLWGHEPCEGCAEICGGDACGTFGGAPYGATTRVRDVPTWAAGAHANGASGTFGRAPYGATNRVRSVPK